MNPLQAYLAVGALLFAIGFIGVITRRNAIVVLMGIELMLNGANVNFLAFWKFAEHSTQNGYLFVLFSIAAAAAESVVGLALIILLYRHFKTTNLQVIRNLRG